MTSSKLKTINFISMLLLALNLVAGILQIHWAVIAVFAVLHAVTRMQYVTAETQLHQAQNPEATQTTIAPPVIKNVASVISAILMAVVLYWLGFGLRYGFDTFLG